MNSSAYLQVKTTSTLSDYRWQSRIVITKVADAKLAEVLKILDAQKEALAERKLEVFLLSESETKHWQHKLPSNNLITELKLTLETQHTILIGLDGGVKVAYDSLDLRDIFRDIDGMPMRRSELNDSKQP